MTIQRILVTGGAGFIGSHTVPLLLAAGYQVVVLDNLSSGKLTNLDLSHPNLEFIEGDVLEYPLVADLTKTCQAVLHLAAIASVPQSIEDPIYTFQVNTQGLLHVLVAVQSVGLPVRLVYASSAAVYGESKSLPCNDTHPLSAKPLSPYALQKMEGEEYAALYYSLHGINSLGLRYFNVYGERQDPHSPYSGVISRFIDAYQADKELVIFGNGEQSRDFISVTDVARANVLALESGYHGQLNVATGQAESLLQLIDYIQAAGEKPPKVRFEAARQGDIKTSYAATDRALEALNFKSTISLREGIRLLMKNQVQ